MIRKPDQDNQPTEKRGKNWVLQVTPGDRLVTSSESFPQQTVHIELDEPLRDPDTKQDIGKVHISGWVLVAGPSDTGTGAGHTGFTTEDFWKKGKSPLEHVYYANFLRYMMIGAHGRLEDLNLATPGYQFTIKHPRLTGEVIALTPRSVQEYQKIPGVEAIVDFQNHCRFVTTIKDDQGKTRKMEYILKSDIVTDPRYLVNAFSSSPRSQNAPALTEAALLWREDNGKWQRGQNAFEVFLGRI